MSTSEFVLCVRSYGLALKDIRVILDQALTFYILSRLNHIPELEDSMFVEVEDDLSPLTGESGKYV